MSRLKSIEEGKLTVNVELIVPWGVLFHILSYDMDTKSYTLDDNMVQIVEGMECHLNLKK